jgi:hypothetical protein
MNLHSALHTDTCGHASLAYLEKRGKFGHGTHSDIDWKATGQAMPPLFTRSGRCNSRMAVSRPTRNHRLDTGARSQESFTSFVLSFLLAQQRGSTEAIPVGTFHDLPAVVQKQDEIGWQSLLEGRPSLGWSEVQQRYYEWLGSRRSGLRWLTALIQKLWDIAWDMWDNRNRVLH